jgi:tellurite methyltransferase
MKSEYQEIIELILSHKKSGKILELGCGKGGTSLALAKKGFEVTCVDISKTAISQIKEEAKKRKIKINAICADLEDYKIKEDYDIIISLGVFHFIPKENLYSLIESMKKHISKEGLTIIDSFMEGDPTQKENSKGYYFKKGELKKEYSEWKIIDYKEYEEFDKEENQTNKLVWLVGEKY